MKYFIFITSIVSFILSLSMLQGCEKQTDCTKIDEMCIAFQVTNAGRCMTATGEYEPWRFTIETDTFYPMNKCSKARLIESRTDEWMGVKLQWVECSETK